MRQGNKVGSSVLLSVVLLVLAIGFSTAISIGSFRQNHTASVMTSFAVAGGKAARNIEQALRYGKPLDDFHGIERFLGQVKASLPEVDRVMVALADGRVMYDENGRATGALSAAEQRQIRRDLAAKPQTFAYDDTSGTYRLFLPIRPEAGGPAAGTLVIVAKGTAVKEYAQAFSESLIQQVGVIALAGAVALLALAMISASRPDGARFQRTGALVVIGLVQIAAGIYSYGSFRDAYIESTQRTTAIVSRILQSDIEGLLQRGVRYDQLHGIETYLAGVQGSVPHFRSIVLDRGGQARPAAQDPGLTRYPLAADGAGASASLGIAVSEEYVERRLRDILLDSGAILLTSLMFMFEMSLLLNRRGQQRPEESAAASEKDRAPQRICSRFLAFLMYFGLFMSASFVPLVMGTFDEGFLGLTGSQAAAIPISVEMAFGSLAILVAGSLIRRFGWLSIAYFGAATIVLAAAAAWLSPSPLAFVAARALTGVGSMCLLVSIYGMIDTIRSQEQRDAALPEMLAGMYAGVNCGAITGALLASQLGYQPVFLVAAAVLALTLAYIRLGVPTEVRAARAEIKAAEAVPKRWGLGDLSVVGFFLLISIPTSAAAMFLPYFFPVFAASLGEGSNVIGRAFLINGLCFVFLGPWLAAKARKHLSPHWTVAVSAGILALALVLFGWQGTLVAAFLAVLLIGIADSFGSPAQSSFVASLPIARRLGRATVQAYQLNARKVGQVVGPLLFSGVAAMGVAGVGVLGMALAVLMVVFVLSAAILLKRTLATA
ncbi:MFS transporter [Arenibaculum pallidiluteum]|uniref:MFS transporter n=1 Tax=Arenibaculum pallidiluteum TaxID=2812559 RepID=UPI001A95D8EF|nr:MFS transporter [Arenibaculum pallidiluteum]